MALLEHGVFLQTFNRLAVALRESKADSAMQEVYFKALEDFPTAIVSQAALLLAKEPTRRFFPTTGEWTAAAMTAQADNTRKFLASPHGWKDECIECEDTGWQRFECTGDSTCGRIREHAPHTYVSVCACRPNNRTYQRHHAS